METSVDTMETMETKDMKMQDLTGREFVEVLASKAPTPGGGGASALAAAIGMALGNMVGSLTVGKKKYADVEADIMALNEEAEALEAELLDLIDADAEAFKPLAAAYGLPSETEEEKAEKARIMEECLVGACEVPLTIMEKCCRAIDLTEEYAAKGSRLALSDAGVSAALLQAALRGASLNVFINTGSMKDRAMAHAMEERALGMMDVYMPKAERIFAEVRRAL